jgi:hypothetical protein
MSIQELITKEKCRQTVTYLRRRFEDLKNIINAARETKHLCEENDGKIDPEKLLKLDIKAQL